MHTFAFGKHEGSAHIDRQCRGVLCSTGTRPNSLNLGCVFGLCKQCCVRAHELLSTIRPCNVADHRPKRGIGKYVRFLHVSSTHTLPFRQPHRPLFHQPHVPLLQNVQVIHPQYPLLSTNPWYRKQATVINRSARSIGFLSPRSSSFASKIKTHSPLAIKRMRTMRPGWRRRMRTMSRSLGGTL